MGVYLIVLTVALAVFIAIASVANGRLPESFSETYYVLKEKIGEGWPFQIVMVAMVFFIAPIWFTLAPDELRFLAFLGSGPLLFVAGAPLFRADGRKLHLASATVAGLAIIIWLCAATPVLLVIPAAAVLTVSLAKIRCSILLLEVAVYLSLVISLLII